MNNRSSFKEMLEDEMRSAPAGIAEYLQLKIDDQTVVIFVEGKDDVPFYTGLIASIESDCDLEFVECFSKTGVVNAHEFISRQDDVRLPRGHMFVCDRDYIDIEQRISENREIFITDYYSIESYLFDHDYIKHILLTKCRMTRMRDRERSVNEIMNRVQEFAFEIRYFAALMWCERLCGGSTNFDDYPINSWFEISGCGRFVCHLKSEETLYSKFGLNDGHRELYNSILKRTPDMDVRLWFRGKHLMQIIRKILSVLPIPNRHEVMSYFGKHGLHEYARSKKDYGSFEVYFWARVKKANA